MQSAIANITILGMTPRCLMASITLVKVVLGAGDLAKDSKLSPAQNGGQSGRQVLTPMRVKRRRLPSFIFMLIRIYGHSNIHNFNIEKLLTNQFFVV